VKLGGPPPLTAAVKEKTVAGGIIGDSLQPISVAMHRTANTQSLSHKVKSFIYLAWSLIGSSSAFHVKFSGKKAIITHRCSSGIQIASHGLERHFAQGYQRCGDGRCSY
jgi:hypothetical protein